MDATSRIGKLDLSNFIRFFLYATWNFEKSEFKAWGLTIFFIPEVSIIPGISTPYTGLNNPATFYFFYH